MDRNLSLERERQIEMATSRATTSDTYDTGLREQPPTLAQRDLLATVLDMKVDVRLEMQRLQQRIGRIEDLMTELIKRLTQDSSGISTPGGDDILPIIPGVIISGMENNSTTVSSLTVTGAVTGSAGVSTSTSVLSGVSFGGIVTTSTVTPPCNLSTSVSTVLIGTNPGGNGLGPILLRKRRSKSRKAPPPPKQSPEQIRLLESEIPSTSSSSRKRDFL